MSSREKRSRTIHPRYPTGSSKRSTCATWQSGGKRLIKTHARFRMPRPRPRSKRLEHREQHDRDQQDRRHLVERTVPAIRPAISVLVECADDAIAPHVIDDEEHHKGELRVHPACAQKRRRTHDHRRTEHGGKRPPDGHHAEELAFHYLESLAAGLVRGAGVVHEQARQVEQTCEPGHDEDDVECLQPKHSVRVLAACATPGGDARLGEQLMLVAGSRRRIPCTESHYVRCECGLIFGRLPANSERWQITHPCARAGWWSGTMHRGVGARLRSAPRSGSCCCCSAHSSTDATAADTASTRSSNTGAS